MILRKRNNRENATDETLVKERTCGRRKKQVDNFRVRGGKKIAVQRKRGMKK